MRNILFIAAGQKGTTIANLSHNLKVGFFGYVNLSMRILFALIVISGITPGIFGQANYPRNYFRNPLGIPMELTANFGELRTNHWHMGLDIRTKQKENLPVYAAAEGYISHVGIRAQSFGRYIILNHPNGLSTLYAHLNDFYPDLEKYVEDQQYKMEKWDVELTIPPGKFKTRKGQLIGYSGNTGGSQGPHLHFEIRDTKSGRALNPALFGLGPKDNVPPTILRLAIYDRERSVYDQAPLFLTLKKTDSGYIVPNHALLKTGSGKISFAIQAYDRFSGSSNPNGIYSARISMDEGPYFGFVLDSITYEETRYLNAHIDYKLRANGGSHFQHISRLPGDQGVIYRIGKGDGILRLEDTAVHSVAIEVKDANQNTSVLNFLIRYDEALRNIGVSRPAEQFIPNEVNVLEKRGFEVYMPEHSLYDTVNVDFEDKGSGFRLNNAAIPLHAEMTVRIQANDVPHDHRDKMLIKQTSGGNTSYRKASWQSGWAMAKFDDFGFFQLVIDTVPPVINDPGKGDTIDLSRLTRIIFQPRDNSGGIRLFRPTLDGDWLRFTNDKGRFFIYKFDERWSYGIHKLEVLVEDLAGNRVLKSWWIKRYPYTPPKKKPVSKKRKTRKK